MKPSIEAHGLEKNYGKTRGLNGLERIAESGQVVAMLGPNGAGKTTVIRAVATLLRLDAGTLQVYGHDVRRAPQTVRRLIGLAGQFAAVEPAMTGRENLEMVARLYGQNRKTARASAGRVLAQLDLEEPADRLARTYSAGCAAASISARAWSGSRGCCSSTSRRPGWILGAGSSASGMRSALSSSQVRMSC